MSNHSIVIPVEDIATATAFYATSLALLTDPAGNQVGFITPA